MTWDKFCRENSLQMVRNCNHQKVVTHISKIKGNLLHFAK